MKVLILTNKVPYPAHDGSSIAMASIISGLLQNKAQVSLLSLNTAKHYKKPEAIAKALPKGIGFNQVYTDNRLKPVSAFLNLLSGAPYHVSRFEVGRFRPKTHRDTRTRRF
ncbi:MAG: hypothetical protein U5L96_05050 [Owenweeksia sp.]|nr:hypothetical protein [Owenweeksia sp.]